MTLPNVQPGLCARCARSRQVVSGRGSVFWMCERAASDGRFRKYPPLPVLRCAGFERTDADRQAEADK